MARVESRRESQRDRRQREQALGAPGNAGDSPPGGLVLRSTPVFLVHGVREAEVLHVSTPLGL